MTEWTAVVVMPPEREDGPMVSRLPSFLHPVAGRPLIWHTVRSLAAISPPPSRVFVAGAVEVAPEFFDGVGVEVRVVHEESGEPLDLRDELSDRGPILLIHASASVERESMRRLLDADDGKWLGTSDASAAAVRVAPADVSRYLELEEPFAVASGLLAPLHRIIDNRGTFVVRTREELARAHRRIRDDLVRSLMLGGTSFVLPESVSIDVGVRIGRDTIIYPGVVLEGETTIGDETVIGPGCRIIDSWVGSGVELKGWNYIAHTSVRNRAILEPYVRRGFD